MLTFQEKEIEDRTQLFGREKELAEFEKLIENQKPMIVILGLRRIGKSSLIHTALKNRDYTIFFNAWGMGLSGPPKREDVVELFKNGIQDFFKIHRDKKTLLKEFFSSISELNFDTPVGGGGIVFKDSVAVKEITLYNFFKSLNDLAKEKGEIIVIAIDEVQELSNSENIDMRKIFSIFWSTEGSNLVLVVTGSEIGTLHDFIREDDVDGVFYGRKRHRIPLEPFDEDTSKRFLLEGLRDGGINISRTIPYDEILNQAISDMGGIVGWLAWFGGDCVKKKKLSLESLEETKEYASKLIGKEFKTFLEKYGNKKTYEKIVHGLAKLSKVNFIKDIIKTTNPKFIKKLIDTGFISKTEVEEIYYFSDPLIGYYFKRNVDLLSDSEKTKSKK